jgi:hypothetical protein
MFHSECFMALPQGFAVQMIGPTGLTTLVYIAADWKADLPALAADPPDSLDLNSQHRQ